MRAVLDANVLVSALLSRSGAPAQLVERWLLGEFELVLSPHLLQEVERTLSSPKLAAQVQAEDAAEFVALLRSLGEVVPDGDSVPRVRSRDPGDDYLIALAASSHSSLVSGDTHLLELAPRIPVESPRSFLDQLA